MARVAVVGGGVGGLVSAIRLAAKGHSVEIFERNESLGGKLAERDLNGFLFDTGPSLLTLPHVFDDVFRVAGSSLKNAVDVQRLEVTFRHHFSDGSGFDAHDQRTLTRRSIEEMGANPAQWDRFLASGAQIWGVAQHSFFSGPLENPFALLRRMRSPLDLLRIDARITLANRASRAFGDERLRMWANRYATYSGSSPWKAPATLACIPFIEQEYGCWHVRGGLTLLANALVETAQSLGVGISTNAEVTAIHKQGDKVTGVEASGSMQRADVVVVNADASHLYRDLYPHKKRLQRVSRAGLSSSAFALLLGVSGRTSGLAHHNLWYSSDQRSEFDAIFEGDGVPSDPTIYVCCSSVTDPSMAPIGDENWFVLVNVGAGSRTDWVSYGDRIVKKLGIEARIVERAMITPDDIENRYRSPGGAIYGTSSNGMRSAFLRSANRGPVRGLYLASGSAHPGGGLPLVALSGSIVAKMIDKDFS